MQNLKAKLATAIFNTVSRSEEVSDLVAEISSLKRWMFVCTVAGLVLPFSGVALWQKLGVKSPWITIGTSAASLVLASSADKKRKKIEAKAPILKTQKSVAIEKEQQWIVNEAFPETIKPHVVNGIGGQVQLALQVQGIQALCANVVDAPAFWRVKLNLLSSVTADEVRKYSGKIQSTLKSPIPVSVTDGDGSCDCAVDIAKPDRDRRFVKIEKYLIDGFHPIGTPITWPAGIDPNNNLITVKALDPNYVHPLIGGGTGSGKSLMLLSWIRWLLQWQPADVQIVLVDPKQVTFGQLENLGRIDNIAQTMGLATERAEQLFPDMKQADAFADRIAPWLPFGIVTDPQEAIQTYSRMAAEMRRRYALFGKWGKQTIEAYNALMLRMQQENPDKASDYPTLPVWVVITDEYYMQVSNADFKKQTEAELSKLGAMARAAGIVMVISTQRPSYDILALKVRDNCMWRLCLRVKGRNPANIILGLPDESDSADITSSLAGKGDMIIEYDGRYERVQCLYWNEESLPPEPTLFPPSLEEDDAEVEAVPEAGAEAARRTATATAKKAKPAAKSNSKASQQEQGEKVLRQVYQQYRKSREAGQSAHRFIVETFGKESYTTQWKHKLFESIHPFLEEWIIELYQTRGEGDAALMPDQIVSLVFGTGFPPTDFKAHAMYLDIVESVIAKAAG